jgi:hypothetical protein
MSTARYSAKRRMGRDELATQRAEVLQLDMVALLAFLAWQR